MKRAAMTAIVTASFVLAFVGWRGLSAQTGAPQPNAAKPAAPAPRTADGHPDLSGVWWFGTDVPLRPLSGQEASPQKAPDGAAVRRAFAPRPTFPQLYQPWAKEKAKTLSDKDDPTLRCIPVAFGTLNVSLFNTGA